MGGEYGQYLPIVEKSKPGKTIWNVILKYDLWEKKYKLTKMKDAHMKA